MLANTACLAISAAIVFYAVKDWGVRYANGTLSWSVTAFFVAFVALSLAGSIATVLYARTPLSRWLRVAAAPAVLAIAGFALGLLKAFKTGDF